MPNIIVTNSFLNDPLQFNEDVRFTPTTLLQATAVENVITRDETGYLVVDTEDEPRLYAVGMASPLYDRVQVGRIIKTAFTEFGING